MKKLFTTICTALLLGTSWAVAQEGTWTHTWDKSRADGGEGFYHITNNDDTTQVAVLNGLEWTFTANTSVTAFAGSTGQYFGSAKSPVTHAELTTSYLSGVIKSVSVEAKKKADTDVTLSVLVGGIVYRASAEVQPQLTTDWATYTFVPYSPIPIIPAAPQEGDICISMDQGTETTGPIYFKSISINYDGAGVQQPVVEKVLPDLAYAVTEVTVEAGDDAFANYLTNPHNVSPITYKAADETIAVIGSNGNIFTTGKVGQTTVTASFAGDDHYLPQDASYTLTVVAKPVIPAPTVSVPAGSYNEAIQVTITSDDEKCKAIWYSTTAKDSLELVDEPIIAAGNSVTITLDQSCTLRCCAVDYNNIGCVTTVDYVINVPLQAAFTAQEASKVYYQMGWDSVEEASTWHYYGVSSFSWTLSTAPFLEKTEPFSVIDPSSTYSLSINYDYENFGIQRERAVSPEIEVRPNSQTEFYACFSGVWLFYADWTFKVNDLTTGTSTQLMSAFDWAQQNEFTGPNWVRFAFDLAEYAGHTCTFEFIYDGQGGDAVSIDGFKLLQKDESADARIVISQGQSIHFQDLSAGHPTAWAWTFEGGTPATSSEQNPVVTYNELGTFGVTLTVSRDGSSDTMTKTAVVEVKAEAPQAHIGLPEGAYRSPWAAAYVPVGVPVTFRDASTGNPEAWTWNFEGTNVATSNEQNPTVTYTAEGLYGLTLDVQNSVGQDHDFLVDAIQAGGALDVWNIEPEESQKIGAVQLGWYGCYAGSNWLGMEAFAEHFDAPLTSATIDKVSAYFFDTTAEDQDALITVSISLPGADGMPGEAIATSQLKVSELQCDESTYVATDFLFDEPVTVDGEFFVTISGFPNTGYYDNVCLACALREQGQKTTTYHLLAEEDENYDLTGNYFWFENTDEPLSLALTAHMAYQENNDDPVALGTIGRTQTAIAYDLFGRRIADQRQLRGVCILQHSDDAARIITVK